MDTSLIETFGNEYVREQMTLVLEETGANTSDLVKWLTIACYDLAQEAAYQRNARHDERADTYRLEAQRCAQLAKLIGNQS